MKAYILAAGEGRRLWPFGRVRNKACVPVGNRPLICHTVAACRAAGIDRITVCCGYLKETIANALLDEGGVTLLDTAGKSGPAATLAHALRLDPPEGGFLVLGGDTLLFEEDIRALIARHEQEKTPVTVLVTPSQTSHDSNEFICCFASDTQLEGVRGHPSRRDYRLMAAYAFTPAFIRFIEGNGGFFRELGVGSMAPHEAFLEQSVADYMHRGGRVPAVTAVEPVIDMDKPWHILEANRAFLRYQTRRMGEREMGEGASIDPSAIVKGKVRLGKGSLIGRNVTINGDIIVGEHTAIDNGAIIDGSAMIGDHVDIRNYCYISGASVIGNRCLVLHGAEFSGTLFDGCHLYHYMEIEGLLGFNVDIGAASVCGTLRFDEGASSAMVGGRRETPRSNANSTYIGDYTRTGVNCAFMPGVRIGTYCAIGPCACITEDVPDETLLLVRQEHITKPWGPEKYGW